MSQKLFKTRIAELENEIKILKNKQQDADEKTVRILSKKIKNLKEIKEISENLYYSSANLQ